MVASNVCCVLSKVNEVASNVVARLSPGGTNIEKDPGNDPTVPISNSKCEPALVELPSVPFYVTKPGLCWSNITDDFSS